MGSGQSQEWDKMKSTVYLIKNALKDIPNEDVKVQLTFLMDLEYTRISLGTVKVDYTVDTSSGGVLDYLVVNEVKKVTEGLPVEFTGYDSSVEPMWDSYNDEMIGCDIIIEYWDTGYGYDYEEEFPLELEDKNEFLSRLDDKGLSKLFYFYIVMDSKGVMCKVDMDEMVSDNSPYLEQKDIVKLTKELLSFGDNTKELLKKVEYRPKKSKIDINDLNKELLQNILVMKQDGKFKNLVRDDTILEEDRVFLYIDTYKREAVLSRYFKGVHIHVNTVYDLPLTMSAKYQVEDLMSVVGTANSKWEKGQLIGKYDRVLLDEDDYSKFANIVRHHLPSLADENGGFRNFKLNLELTGESPFDIVESSGGTGYTLLKRNGTTKSISGILNFDYDGSNPYGENFKTEFYSQVKAFVDWVKGTD